VGISAFWLLEWIVFVLTLLNGISVDTLFLVELTAPYAFLNLALMIALYRKEKQMGDHYRPLGSKVAGLVLCVLLVLGTITGVYYYGYAIVDLVLWNIIALSSVVLVYFVTMRNRVTFSTDNSIRGV